MYTEYDEHPNEFLKVEEPGPSHSYTYADYIKWKFEERLELFRGRIYKLAIMNTKHQEISGNLFHELFGFIKSKNCKVFSAPFDVRFPVRNRKKDTEITTVGQPDICVICDETKLDERGCCGAPDLIIEILSPGNSTKELRLKYERYEEAGVKEYWIVQPTSENVSVLTLAESGKYNGAEMYTGSDNIRSKVIPGIIVKVNDIFT